MNFISFFLFDSNLHFRGNCSNPTTVTYDIQMFVHDLNLDRILLDRKSCDTKKQSFTR